MNDPRGMVNLGLDMSEERTKSQKEKPQTETAFIEVPLENISEKDPELEKDTELEKEFDELDRRIRGGSRSRRTSSFAVIDKDDDKIDEEDAIPSFEGESVFSRRMIIAGGFLDIALFTTNCEQLKSILEIGEYHNYYQLVLGLLVASMVLQVAAGFTLFMAGCVTIKNPDDKKRSDIMNHISVGLVALITVVNIFISSFTVKGEVIQRCIRGNLL